jgi:hypothetical protein
MEISTSNANDTSIYEKSYGRVAQLVHKLNTDHISQ